jgi:hypothetical protein
VTPRERSRPSGEIRVGRPCCVAVGGGKAPKGRKHATGNLDWIGEKRGEPHDRERDATSPRRRGRSKPPRWCKTTRAEHGTGSGFPNPEGTSRDSRGCKPAMERFGAETRRPGVDSSTRYGGGASLETPREDARWRHRAVGDRAPGKVAPRSRRACTRDGSFRMQPGRRSSKAGMTRKPSQGPEGTGEQPGARTSIGSFPHESSCRRVDVRASVIRARQRTSARFRRCWCSARDLVRREGSTAATPGWSSKTTRTPYPSVDPNRSGAERRS